MKAETGIGLLGAVVGVALVTVAFGPQDMVAGALYGIAGGVVAIGVYRFVKWARSQ